MGVWYHGPDGQAREQKPKMGLGISEGVGGIFLGEESGGMKEEESR